MRPEEILQPLLVLWPESESTSSPASPSPAGVTHGFDVGVPQATAGQAVELLVLSVQMVPVGDRSVGLQR